jgi:LmbE family N-acetylglucosaminyl deacetylase
MKKFKLSIIFVLALLCLNAQGPKKQVSSAEIHHAIQKLNFLGSALYVAAHPDDENTRLIAYLANDVKAKTTYLSMTRGDGGQNLIGAELKELLGVLRTQELLMARSVDGGSQAFTRANDFGYSKNPEETFNKWDKEQVMEDVIWAIRKFRPDIIVNRFNHNTSRRTHGHHTGSAKLSFEVFDMAADPNVYPEQLKYVEPWQPTRLFFNTSWWFYGSREKFAEADKSKLLAVDIGTYYPMLGISNSEIAAFSRSMHKCQGFGSTGTRGSMNEYLELVKGEMPTEKSNLFEGINTSWSRVPNGERIGDLVSRIDREFDHTNPAASVPDLMDCYRLMKAFPNHYWIDMKMAELKDIIVRCMGLYLEAAADESSAIPGQEIEIAIEAVNRSGHDAWFKGYSINPGIKDTLISTALEPNQVQQYYPTISLPKSIGYTSPYWLTKKGVEGMYTVEDQLLRGLPETPRELTLTFNLSILGEDFSVDRVVIYKKNDPAEGEVYTPFDITPPVFISLEDPVYIFSGESKVVRVNVRSGRKNISGQVTLDVADGWQVSPSSYKYEIIQKGGDQDFEFKLTPPKGASETIILPKAFLDDKIYSEALIEIDYDHIPRQNVILDASSKAVNLDIQKRGERVAYIMGAGDEVPVALQQIGYEVDVLELSDVSLKKLQSYDALMMGIRAYNTLDDITYYQETFMDYVKSGGTMVIQYNTNRRLKEENLGPYPLKLSRKRVAVEEAEMRILAGDHPVLNGPNVITQNDFENWVQERGLYFPEEWDDAYTAIFSCNDPDEEPNDGSLLVAQHGDGWYVYTGISFFRQLPAGVPGAYRLLANILSLGGSQM